VHSFRTSGDEFHHLIDTQARDLADLIARAQPERMRNDRDRQAGVAERARLRFPERDKCSRTDRDRGRSALRYFDTVVDTPRRAGASVARARNDYVALTAELFYHFGLRRDRSRRLSALDYASDAVLAHQELAEVVGKQSEVRLRVVDKAHDFAGETGERQVRATAAGVGLAPRSRGIE
jgi:hypothetical protein